MKLVPSHGRARCTLSAEILPGFCCCWKSSLIFSISKAGFVSCSFCLRLPVLAALAALHVPNPWSSCVLSDRHQNFDTATRILTQRVTYFRVLRPFRQKIQRHKGKQGVSGQFRTVLLYRGNSWHAVHPSRFPNKSNLAHVKAVPRQQKYIGAYIKGVFQAPTFKRNDLCSHQYKTLVRERR